MTDAVFPGERERFVPAASEVVVQTLVGPALANVTPVSVAEQRAIDHNRLRYHELQKLRMGMPNQYNETRYR